MLVQTDCLPLISENGSRQISSCSIRRNTI
jgi:hypothetical protein